MVSTKVQIVNFPLHGLDRALEESLVARCFAVGVNYCNLNTPWLQHPFAVMGQSIGEEYRFENFKKGSRRISPHCGYLQIPEQRYRVLMSKGQKNEFLWTHVSFSLFGSLDLFALIDVPTVFPPKVGKRIGAVNLAQLKNGKSEENMLKKAAKRKTLTLELLSIILDYATLKPKAKSLVDGHSRMLPVLQFMETNLAEPIDRDELAGLVHLSPSRFHYVFKRTVGKAPVTYLLELRLRRAQHLLITTELAVNEICRSSGFGDPFHFSRQFKTFTGKSPRLYRNDYRREWAESFEGKMTSD